MSIDGVFIHKLTQEMAGFLVGGKVSKIHHPYSEEVVLQVRNNRVNHKLLLSAHPLFARFNITQDAFPVAEPSVFLMTLRKHLDGAIIQGFRQVGNDRIVEITFSKRNELGDLNPVKLVIEMMGRHSNIILVREEDSKILEVIKHVGFSQNSYRTLLPGSTYIEAPRREGALNPFSLDELGAMKALNSASEFEGLGRDTREELFRRIDADLKNKVATFLSFFKDIDTHDYAVLALYNGRLTPLPFVGYEVEKTFATFSELLDAFYKEKSSGDRLKQIAGDLIQKIQNELKKNDKKIGKLEDTLKQADEAEILRVKGELLTTYAHTVERGIDVVMLENYYDENRMLKVELDIALNANQNAQKYFKKYQKLKNGVKIVQEQLAETRSENAYLYSVLSELEIAGVDEVEDIREELVATGYVKARKSHNRKNSLKSKPRVLSAPDGTRVVVGKNNLQNDELTMKKAKKNWWWYHAKDIPGSHVIIEDENPSEETRGFALNAAAYYSKFRTSANVPVDYVQVKNIKKPNGSKPGYVIYTGQENSYVTPVEPDKWEYSE
ncbi:MAG: NFACT family protein [Lactobacillales bacterium]|jgi:predicted ribosome quality control (RQC) complex YloA/Tae2 family protein|nr:NFACT family protein [Lactobacillales bacterium]